MEGRCAPIASMRSSPPRPRGAPIFEKPLWLLPHRLRVFKDPQASSLLFFIVTFPHFLPRGGRDESICMRARGRGRLPALGSCIVSLLHHPIPSPWPVAGRWLISSGQMGAGHRERERGLVSPRAAGDSPPSSDLEDGHRSSTPCAQDTGPWAAEPWAACSVSCSQSHGG